MHGFRIAERPRVHRFRIAERPRAIGGRTVKKKGAKKSDGGPCPEDFVFRRRDGGKRISREGGEMRGALPRGRTQVYAKVFPWRSTPISLVSF